MTNKQKTIESQKWDAIINFFTTKISDGETLDIQAVLFLIGIRELGVGYTKFKKDEKLNVMHVAVCTILEPFGFYEFEKNDDEGWPHFILKKELPKLSHGEQTILLKKAILHYFEQEELLGEKFYEIENQIN